MGEYRELFMSNLRRILERRKYTSRQVAEGIGTSDVMLSRWMTGKNLPSDTFIDALAEFLEVEIIEFFRPVKKRKIKSLRDQNSAYLRRRASKAEISAEVAKRAAEEAKEEARAARQAAKALLAEEKKKSQGEA